VVFKKIAKTNQYKMRTVCTVRSVLDLLLFVPVILFLKTTVTCAHFFYFTSLVQGVSLNPLMESMLKIHVQQYLLSWP